jgi:hypothetical protein
MVVCLFIDFDDEMIRLLAAGADVNAAGADIVGRHCRRLGITGLEEEQADIKKLVQRYLSQESAGRLRVLSGSFGYSSGGSQVGYQGTKARGSPFQTPYLPSEAACSAV